MESGDVCGRVVWDSKCKVGRYPFIRKKVTTFAEKEGEEEDIECASGSLDH